MKKRRTIWDIETNGLLDEVTRMWLFMLKDRDTGERFYWEEGDMGWQQFIEAEVESMTGHNILGYDKAVLIKLFHYTIPDNIRLQDTLLMSQALDYWRFGPHGGHSLEEWGNFLNFPKQPSPDFSVYTPYMLEYGLNDLDLNEKVVDILLEEFKAIYKKNPLIARFLLDEHAAANWQAESQVYGWPFDEEGARRLYEVLVHDSDEIRGKLESRLGYKLKYADKVGENVQVKVPKWKADGAYHKSLADYFGIDPFEGLLGEDRPIDGPFTRVSIEPLRLSSAADVKIFLYRHDWIPTEWNMKKCPETQRKIKSSPKITEDSLEILGADGQLYTKFNSAESRLSIVKTWLANSRNGRLHGDSFHIGTPSMRVRHSVIVNIPSSDSAYGPEMRSLFRVPEGWTMVGADSSGNQARGLAHYLNDDEFTYQLLEGDIHQYNADLLTAIMRKLLNQPDFLVPRSAAKRILYAFLFGAAGGKLWGYIMGAQNQEKGAALKREFTKAVPGFEKLGKALEAEWDRNRKETGFGYITSIFGNKIYVDSKHKLLVYLLQSAEKATCSGALEMTVQGLKDAQIPYQALIYYHDEIDFMVPTVHAEAAKAISKAAFKEAPKRYGITIMDGEAKLGHNWLDVH